MSTPEQPAQPPLTRRQLREIRNTGATPIITPIAEDNDADASSAGAGEDVDASAAPLEAAAAPVDAAPVMPTPVPAAPLPKAAVPAIVADAPGADSAVDLGTAPLTRRQARQQERIRTASVPVISPDVADVPPPIDTVPGIDEPADGIDPERADDAGTAEADDSDDDDIVDDSDDSDRSPLAGLIEASSASVSERDDVAKVRPIVHPALGAEVLTGEPGAVTLPPSFDQLISRSATGSLGTPNALILSQAPAAAPLVAPVTATGEVLVTGTFALPDGLGSRGHAAGAADGKEVDAVLVDREIPAHSSPTPIAASAAISTVKNAGEIIQPPAPEKGGRLMMTLAITAGALALALVGVLIAAIVTGVF